MRKIFTIILQFYTTVSIAQFPISVMNRNSAASIIYATFDPLNTGPAWTLSGGNLVASGGNTVNSTTVATVGHSTGKYYFEFVWTSVNSPGCGIPSLLSAGIINGSFSVSGTTPLGGDVSGNSYGWGGYGTGTFNFQNVALRTTYGSCYCGGGYGATNMCAIDYDNGKIWFGQSGTWFASGNPATGANPANVGHLFTGTWFPAFFHYNAQVVTVNFGASAFTYSPPSGFTAGYY